MTPSRPASVASDSTGSAPLVVTPPAVATGSRRGTLSGWGRVPMPGSELRGERLEVVTRDAPLSRGLGRSYGDSSIPAPHDAPAASTVLADRVLAFDPGTGVLRAEAGLSLVDLRRVFLDRGWFTPVTPGTQFVTLGGMVASDVHGKNHHVDGCIGRHVRSLRMRVASGDIVTASRTDNADLFRATIGGMGLTGHILEVELGLAPVRSPWIFQEQFPVADIDSYVAALQESASDWPFTMGWIDCLSRGRHMGRGILIRGRWAEAGEAPARKPVWKPARLTVPFTMPSWLLNPLTIRTFNALYYRKTFGRKTAGVVHPGPFFYPLDSIRHWNRLYGPRGFTQYQCVLPRADCRASARALLDLLTREGGASFLCVIKDCGEQGEGTLSFPMPGISIALDLAIEPGTPALVDRLNAFVIEAGGRIYLTKDTFTRAEHFRAMEPRLDEFLAIREAWDPTLRFRSAQSVRIFGDPAVSPARAAAATR